MRSLVSLQDDSAAKVAKEPQGTTDQESAAANRLTSVMKEQAPAANEQTAGPSASKEQVPAA